LMYNQIKGPYSKDRTGGINFLEERFNYSEVDANSIYDEVQAIKTNDEANSWIAPWPSYYSGLVGCQNTSNMVICGNGVKVNLSSYETTVATQQGSVQPSSIFYLTKNDIKEKKFENNVQPFSVLLLPEKNGYISILVDPKLGKAMFTRLFFMDGHGLKHFKLFTYEKSPIGNEVYVYKVDWRGGEKNIIEALRPPINKTNESNIIVSKGSANFTNETK